MARVPQGAIIAKDRVPRKVSYGRCTLIGDNNVADACEGDGARPSPGLWYASFSHFPDGWRGISR